MKRKKVLIDKELLFDTLLFVFGVAMVALLYMNNILLTLIILAGWITAIKLWHVKHDIYLFGTAAVLGSIAEIAAIKTGAWQYSNPSLLGIPVWLPLLWGIAVVFINRVANALAKF